MSPVSLNFKNIARQSHSLLREFDHDSDSNNSVSFLMLLLLLSVFVLRTRKKANAILKGEIMQREQKIVSKKFAIAFSFSLFSSFPQIRFDDFVISSKESAVSNV